ncbi:unnamed protein product, partial [Ectocarpus sp. 4 AP-2014]
MSPTSTCHLSHTVIDSTRTYHVTPVGHIQVHLAHVGLDVPSCSPPKKAALTKRHPAGNRCQGPSLAGVALGLGHSFVQLFSKELRTDGMPLGDLARVRRHQRCDRLWRRARHSAVSIAWGFARCLGENNGTVLTAGEYPGAYGGAQQRAGQHLPDLQRKCWVFLHVRRRGRFLIVICL